MTVAQFFFGGVTHIHYIHIIVQSHTGQWRVAIDGDVVAVNFADGNQHWLAHIAFRMELHAHFQLDIAKGAAWNHLSDLRVIFTVSIFGFNHQAE